MLNTNEIQMKYNDLYCTLREYIWDIKIVEYIAELEIAAYEKFPDIEDVKRKLQTLKYRIRSTILEDEEMQEAFDAFEDCLNSKDSESLYSPIEKPQEVIAL